ncbi:MAG: type transport system permease protein [Gaiellales bacterium]|nr:type transport system permease protein [Gaiellales bacterium]
MSRTLVAAFELGRRGFRNIIRVPFGFLPSLIIPMFLLAVNVGALSHLGSRFSSGNYVSFFVPTAIMLSVTNGATGSGMAVVRDIASGYFDKLLLAPIPRISIVLGRLSADATRASIQATIVLTVGLIAGGGLAAGPGGFVAIVLLMALWTLAYAGLSLSIAMFTGNTDATQAAFLFGFPFVFLSSATVPRDQMASWMRTIADHNPATLVIEAMRHLITTGWSTDQVLRGMGGIAIVACITVPLSLIALRRRVATGAGR